jgi:hypothetical protein
MPLGMQLPRLDRGAYAFGPALVAREDGVEALAEEHLERFVEAVEEVGVGGRRPVAVGVHGDDLVPRPECARQRRRLRRLEGTRRDRVEADPGRHHQALLRAADGDVDAPVVVAQVGAGQARDRIDQQQGRMAGGVDRLANRLDVGKRAGRGLVVDDANRLDLLLAVLAQARLDLLGLDAAAPVRRFRQERVAARRGEHLGGEAEAGRHFLPEGGEMTGLDHQHRIAGAQGVDEGRLPGAGARRRVDDDRMACLEDLADVDEDLPAEGAELRPAVVDRRQAHRPQDAIGHRARPGDLQEVAAGGMEVEVEHDGVWWRRHSCTRRPGPPRRLS